MKKIVLILALVFSLAMQAQRSVTIDTIQGAETVNFAAMEYPTAIQALCTQTGGTSDGTLRLQASLDGTSWQYITETDGFVNFYPNDTLTIVNGAVYLAHIKSKAFPFYRIVGAGTSGDSTKITIKYSK